MKNPKPYYLAPEEEQIRRLRAVAKQFLTYFEIPKPTIRCVQHSNNTTFRVTDANQQQYALRIGRERAQAGLFMRSEMQWLEAIAQETTIPVLEPVWTSQKTLSHPIKTDDIPAERWCVMTKWMDGRFRHTYLNADCLAKVGKNVALLHQHSQQWQRPEGFYRPVLDEHAPLRTRAAALLQQEHYPVSPEERTLFLSFMQQAGQVLADLGRDPAFFNLIHADLHAGNWLFQDDRVGFLDFDDCCDGHFLYDISVIFFYLRKRRHFTDLKTSFLRAYQDHGGFWSDEYAQKAGWLMTLRKADLTLWFLASPNQQTSRKKLWAKRWKATITMIQRFLEERKHDPTLLPLF